MRKILIAVLVVVFNLITVPALAEPPSEGCPRGFLVWNTATEPYQADNRSDENDDGLVCAIPLGNQTATLTDGTVLQIYLFFDNTLPATR